MIVAGFGCRRQAGTGDLLAALELALGERGVARDAVRLLAAPAFKRGEEGIAAAARALGLPLLWVEDASMMQAAVAAPDSVAEAAALAAAGSRGRLLGRRSAVPSATCALAAGEDLAEAGR
ncbi:MAG: hypothetical protein OHK0024_31240 [Thalassobaculales bacterium]